MSNKNGSKPSLIEYSGIRGGLDYTRGFVGVIQNYLPTQDSLLEQKSGGDLELYEVVATDDQVKSCLQQRFRALLSKDWEVIPGGEKRIDKQAAEHLKQQLEAIDWDGKSEKMLWGLHYGYSAAEILYKRSDDKVEIADIRVRNRRRFHFNEDQKLVLKTMKNPLGEDLPERKFWHFCTGADHDDEPYGRGLGYWLYWPTFFKRQGVRWWMKFVEKYAAPTRLGKYPAGSTKEDQNKLWNALASFGDDSRSMIPENLTMEFLESSRAGTVDYKALCDQMDGAIAKIILSQTMTTDDGSSKSQAEVHEGVKDEVIESDSDLLSESFNNSVAIWLTDWNFPGAAYPKVQRKLKADPDPSTMADTDAKLQGLGISLKPEAIAARYGSDYLVPDNADQIPQLNGEQVNALVTVITQATQGGWSPKLVAGVINGAFPNWPDEAVAAITDNLGSATPPEDPNNPAGADGAVPPVPPAQIPGQAAPSLDDVAGMFSEAEFKLKEGTTKQKNGVTYVLINSRWKRQDPKPKPPGKSKKTPLSEDAKQVVKQVKEASNAKAEVKSITPNKKKDSQNEKSRKELDRLVAGIDKAKDKRLQMAKIYEEFSKTGIGNEADILVDKIKISSQYSGLSASSSGNDTQTPDNMKRNIRKVLSITNGIGVKNLKEVTIEGYESSSDLEAGTINAATNPLTGSNRDLNINNPQAFAKHFSKFVEREIGAKAGSLSGLGNFLVGANEMLDLYQNDRAKFDAALNFLKQTRGWKEETPTDFKKQPKAKTDKMGANVKKTKLSDIDPQKIVGTQPKAKTDKMGANVKKTKLSDIDPQKIVGTQPESLEKAREKIINATGEEAVEKAEKATREILNSKDTGVYIRVSTNNIAESILKSRFKSSLEFNSAGSNYDEMREQAEEILMGYDSKTKAADRPIYGYFGSQKLDDNTHGAARQYGNIAFKLKDDVKGRATFANDDTFSSGLTSSVKNPNAASLVRSSSSEFGQVDREEKARIEGAAKAKNINDLIELGNGTRYFEAQIHGQVKPSDIDEIHFNDPASKPSSAIIELAKKNGIKIFQNGKELN